MTREEVLAMMPGRELDVTVQNNVMRKAEIVIDHNGQFWIDGINKLPHYSTDISAVWEVVTNIGNRNDWMLYRLGHHENEDGSLGFECIFLNVNVGNSATAKGNTAPEAICKAALLAVLNL